MSEQQPGDDWIFVNEGEELTPEQAARKFLSLSWPEQVERMTWMLEDVGAASACRMLNHEGAMIFATQHSCHVPEPETVQGEIVTAEPQSITPLDQLAWAMTERDIEIDQELDQ